MHSFLNELVFYVLILQQIECQYVSRGANFYHNPYRTGLRYTPDRFNSDHKKGYNIFHNINNEYKNNDNNNEKPVAVQYYYEHKPHENKWNDVKPVHKPESFAVDYSEDEYSEPSPDEKNLDSFHPGVDYEKDENEEHHENDFKVEAGKKFGALDKHSDSGHREAEFSKVGGYHDKHLDGRTEAEHEKFKKDGEYSHDRGHGFIKSWSWDRKNIKGNAEGEKTKAKGEITAGSKGAFGAVAAKGSESHDKKGLTALAGGAAYSKTGHEEDSRKSLSTGAGKSDYDKEFPIFG